MATPDALHVDPNMLRYIENEIAIFGYLAEMGFNADQISKAQKFLEEMKQESMHRTHRRVL